MINKLRSASLNNTVRLPPGDDTVTDLSARLLQRIAVRDLSTLKFPSRLDLSDERFQLERLAGLESINAPAICDLDLTDNPISEATSLDLNRFTALRNLVLVQCQFSRLPSTLALSQLVTLDLSNNKLTMFPTVSLPRLRDLRLAHNEIAGILPQIGAEDCCPRLKLLDLAYNSLDWDQNDLIESATNMATVARLQELVLEGNPSTDNLPNFRLWFAGKLPKLKVLDAKPITRDERKAARESYTIRASSSRRRDTATGPSSPTDQDARTDASSSVGDSEDAASEKSSSIADSLFAAVQRPPSARRSLLGSMTAKKAAPTKAFPFERIHELAVEIVDAAAASADADAEDGGNAPRIAPLAALEHHLKDIMRISPIQRSITFAKSPPPADQADQVHDALEQVLERCRREAALAIECLVRLACILLPPPFRGGTAVPVHTPGHRTVQRLCALMPAYGSLIDSSLLVHMVPLIVAADQPLEARTCYIACLRDVAKVTPQLRCLRTIGSYMASLLLHLNMDSHHGQDTIPVSDGSFEGLDVLILGLLLAMASDASLIPDLHERGVTKHVLICFTVENERMRAIKNDPVKQAIAASTEFVAGAASDALRSAVDFASDEKRLSRYLLLVDVMATLARADTDCCKFFVSQGLLPALLDDVQLLAPDDVKVADLPPICGILLAKLIDCCDAINREAPAAAPSGPAEGADAGWASSPTALLLQKRGFVSLVTRLLAEESVPHPALLATLFRVAHRIFCHPAIAGFSRSPPVPDNAARQAAHFILEILRKDSATDDPAVVDAVEAMLVVVRHAVETSAPNVRGPLIDHLAALQEKALFVLMESAFWGPARFSAAQTLELLLADSSKATAPTDVDHLVNLCTHYQSLHGQGGIRLLVVWWRTLHTVALTPDSDEFRHLMDKHPDLPVLALDTVLWNIQLDFTWMRSSDVADRDALTATLIALLRTVPIDDTHVGRHKAKEALFSVLRHEDSKSSKKLPPTWVETTLIGRDIGILFEALDRVPLDGRVAWRIVQQMANSIEGSTGSSYHRSTSVLSRRALQVPHDHDSRLVDAQKQLLAYNNGTGLTKLLHLVLQHRGLDDDDVDAVFPSRRVVETASTDERVISMLIDDEAKHELAELGLTEGGDVVEQDDDADAIATGMTSDSVVADEHAAPVYDDAVMAAHKARLIRQLGTASFFFNDLAAGSGQHRHQSHEGHHDVSMAQSSPTKSQRGGATDSEPESPWQQAAGDPPVPALALASMPSFSGISPVRRGMALSPRTPLRSPMVSPRSAGAGPTRDRTRTLRIAASTFRILLTLVWSKDEGVRSAVTKELMDPRAFRKLAWLARHARWQYGNAGPLLLLLWEELLYYRRGLNLSHDTIELYDVAMQAVGEMLGPLLRKMNLGADLHAEQELLVLHAASLSRLIARCLSFCFTFHKTSRYADRYIHLGVFTILFPPAQLSAFVAFLYHDVRAESLALSSATAKRAGAPQRTRAFEASLLTRRDHARGLLVAIVAEYMESYSDQQYEILEQINRMEVQHNRALRPSTVNELLHLHGVRIYHRALQLFLAPVLDGEVIVEQAWMNRHTRRGGFKRVLMVLTPTRIRFFKDALTITCPACPPEAFCPEGPVPLDRPILYEEVLGIVQALDGQRFAVVLKPDADAAEWGSRTLVFGCQSVRESFRVLQVLRGLALDADADEAHADVASDNFIRKQVQKQLLNPGAEAVLLSSPVTKINKRGVRQDRIIVLTTERIYNFYEELGGWTPTRSSMRGSRRGAYLKLRSSHGLDEITAIDRHDSDGEAQLTITFKKKGAFYHVVFDDDQGRLRWLRTLTELCVDEIFR